jgi:hypothetical protein
MKNCLVILVVCMIASQANANQSPMCTFKERKNCFRDANELCTGLPYGEKLTQCVRDLSVACVPSITCSLGSKITEEDIIRSLQPPPRPPQSPVTPEDNYRPREIPR